MSDFHDMTFKQPNDGDAQKPFDDHQAIIEGLLKASASIAPKYFYDALGCRLFEVITLLPAYYPTRIESDIFLRSAPTIGKEIGEGAILIDLGAGNCEKAAGLFDVLKPQRYIAVDIASDFLDGVLKGLQERYPHLVIEGHAYDFSEGLTLPPDLPKPHRVMFYPGSSIGNFTPDDAMKFLREIRKELHHGGHLLIGVDLIKEDQILDLAYNDPLGITAAFNRNILNHINRLIGSDFDLADFNHVAFYHREENRIEMHLEAQRDLLIQWPGGERHFRKKERIQTEYSYKYHKETFASMLKAAGFQGVKTYLDDAGWFSLFHAEAG